MKSNKNLKQEPPVLLVAVDLTPGSTKVVQTSVAMARVIGASIVLLNVIDLALPALSGDGPSLEVMEALRRHSYEGLKGLSLQVRDVKVAQEVVETFGVADTILERVRSIGPAMLVMGTGGKHGLSKIAFGSTAEAVFRRSSCPVLLVGPKAVPPTGEAPFQHILYAGDLKDEPSPALGLAETFARRSQGELRLLHVMKEPQISPVPLIETEAAEELMRCVSREVREAVRVTAEAVHGEPSEKILAVARRFKPDLILLGARRATFWLTYFDSGVTPAICAGASCPVLVVGSEVGIVPAVTEESISSWTR